MSENIFWNKERTSSNNWTRHHEGPLFLHDREFPYVTLDIAEESFTKMTLPLKKFLLTKKPTTYQFLPPVASYSLQSPSADGLMPVSVNRSHSVKFTKIVVLSISSDSGSSALLKSFVSEIPQCLK